MPLQPTAAAEASKPPLGDLGWQGVSADDPEVEALRATLAAEAGIKGLEIVDPQEPDYAKRAAAIFRRDGFVLVKDMLSEEQLARVRSGCDTVIRGIVERDPTMTSNRGSHRYSFGSTPAFFGQHDAWAAMIEPERLHEVLREIWGSDGFICTSGANNGGDFVLPGCVEYQNLHRDMGDFFPKASQGEKGMAGNTNRDVVADWRDTPPPVIVCNFPMEIVQGSPIAHTALNGATRQIPGTQSSRSDTPSLAEEPRWMKLSTTAPAPAGAAMIRDIRAWHVSTLIRPPRALCSRLGRVALTLADVMYEKIADNNALGCVVSRAGWHSKRQQHRARHSMLCLARPVVRARQRRCSHNALGHICKAVAQGPALLSVFGSRGGGPNPRLEPTEIRHSNRWRRRQADCGEDVIYVLNAGWICRVCISQN